MTEQNIPESRNSTYVKQLE